MRTKHIFLSACIIKPEGAWDLVHCMRTLQVTRKSAERALLADFQRRR
jgi:hypothetical protein